MESLPNTIYAGVAVFAYVILGQRLADDLSSIRRRDLRTQLNSANLLRTTSTDVLNKSARLVSERAVQSLTPTDTLGGGGRQRQ
jgi:hypothetical protein